MSQLSVTDQRRIRKLFNLADVATDFMDPNLMELVNHFHAMREDIGLAALLLLIQRYFEQKDKS